MVTSTREIKLLLKAIGQGDALVEDFEIPQLASPIVAVEASPQSSMGLWRGLKNRISETGCIPLLVSLLGNPQPSWRRAVKADGPHLFNRHPFIWELGEASSADVAPEAIATRSGQLDIRSELGERRSHFELDAEAAVEWKLDSLKQCYGEAPSKAQVLRAIRGTSEDGWMAGERFMFDWSSKRKEIETAPRVRTYWHKPIEPCALLLLPISDQWKIPAYIHWYGAENIGSETVCASLRFWEEAYGAHLVCHYGTMLQFQVSKPIRSHEEAFDVAIQHETMGMMGSAFETARLLTNARRWHLHLRP